MNSTDFPRLIRFALFLITLFSLQSAAAFEGRLIDAATKQPVTDAWVFDTLSETRSDANGTFALETNASQIHVKAYGYRPAKLSTMSDSRQHLIEPIDVKALYLSFWGARPDSKTVKRVLKIINETPVNALVVDVKNEFGLTSYKLSRHTNADRSIWYQRTIKDMEAFMKLMKERNIYMIARIVVFKDELQATNFPHRALKLDNGEIWKNREKMAWVDPFDPRTHDYTLDVAVDAAKAGFDEINFDYVRFPAKPDLSYSKPYNQENRVAAIDAFLKRAQERLRPYGTFISADTYGYVCWNRNDTNIGHTVASLARHADYLAPMLYPSGFPSGTLTRKDPTRHNYEILSRSISNMHRDIQPERIRPWLQAFKDYAHSKRLYKERQIAEQIHASDDMNTSGWMLWNPSSRYQYVHPELFDTHLRPDNIRLLEESYDSLSDDQNPFAQMKFDDETPWCLTQ